MIQEYSSMVFLFMAMLVMVLILTMFWASNRIFKTIKKRRMMIRKARGESNEKSNG